MYTIEQFRKALPEGAVFKDAHPVNGYVMAVEGTVKVGGRLVAGVWDSDGKFRAYFRQEARTDMSITEDSVSLQAVTYSQPVSGFDEVHQLPYNQTPYGEYCGLVVQRFPFFNLKLE